MMRFELFVLVIVSAVWIDACTVAPEPMGETPVRLGPDEWEGTWMTLGDDDIGTVTVDVLDSEKGALRLHGFESGKPFSMVVLVRTHDNWLFASVASDYDEKPYNPDLTDDEELAAALAAGEYLWVRIVKHDNYVFAWSPDTDKFNALIDAGKLPGIEGGSDAVLGTFGPEDFELVMSESEGVLFDWDDPIAFVRLGDGSF